MRIGIVGTDSSHTDLIVGYFNHHQRFPGHRIVALAGGDPARNERLAATAGIGIVVATPEELLGQVDAAIICSRDGRGHLQEALPLLSGSVPLLIDKPLACDAGDASAIIAAARDSGTLVTSYSPLRWAAETRRVIRKLGPDRRTDSIAVTGPADARSPYGGIVFYGFHVADISAALAPPGPIQVEAVVHRESAIAVIARTNATRLDLTFVPQSRDGQSWILELDGPRGPMSEQIIAGPDYLLPGLGVFMESLATGRCPLSADDLLAPVALMAEIARVLAPALADVGPGE